MKKGKKTKTTTTNQRRESIKDERIWRENVSIDEGQRILKKRG